MSEPEQLQQGAPCHNPDDAPLWFSGKSEEQKIARTLCNTSCHIKSWCLDTALEFEEMSGASRLGIFGGTNAAERIKIRQGRLK